MVRNCSRVQRNPADSVGFRRIPADSSGWRQVPPAISADSVGIPSEFRRNPADRQNLKGESAEFGRFRRILWVGTVSAPGSVGIRRNSVGFSADFRRIFGGCPSDEIESVGFRRNPSESVGFAAHGVGLCMGFVGFRRISSESAGIRRIPMDPPDVRRIFGGFSADFRRIFGGLSSDCMRFSGIRRNPTESVGFPPDFLRYSLAGQSQNLIPMMPAAKRMHTWGRGCVEAESHTDSISSLENVNDVIADRSWTLVPGSDRSRISYVV